MTAIEFKNQWPNKNNSLNLISLDSLNGLNLQQKTIDFLYIAGLPEDAAPFLSFAKNTKELYKSVTRLTTQYDILKKEYDKYIVIGSDGGGNPVAVDTSDNDKIVWLDHEDYFSSRYMNSSIETLAETLMIYRDFISQMLIENGDDAYLNSNFTDEQFEKLKQSISIIDNKAITKDGF